MGSLHGMTVSISGMYTMALPRLDVKFVCDDACTGWSRSIDCVHLMLLQWVPSAVSLSESFEPTAHGNIVKLHGRALTVTYWVK